MTQAQRQLDSKPKIISASRRTDIPAFYSDWLLRRIRAGVVAVPNPVNPTQVAWLSLEPEDVQAIVLWTRDASPLMPHLTELDERKFIYYFQYSITPYPGWLQPNAPKPAEATATFVNSAGGSAASGQSGDMTRSSSWTRSTRNGMQQPSNAWPQDSMATRNAV